MKVLEVQTKKIMTKSNWEMATAYQGVLDSINDKDMDGSIREAFNTYTDLIEQRDSEEINKFQEFVNKNSWGDDCGRILIDATDLESFYKSLKKL